MATSKIGDNRVIHSQGREIIYNVWTFVSVEARDDIKIPSKSVGSRVMASTVISKRTLARIIEEGNEVDNVTSASFSAPRKSRPKKEKVAVVDACDEEVIRRLIHSFHVTQKQRPLIRENTNFKGGKTSLRIILKKLGFRYLKTHLSKLI
jgi:transposase